MATQSSWRAGPGPAASAGPAAGTAQPARWAQAASRPAAVVKEAHSPAQPAAGGLSNGAGAAVPAAPSTQQGAPASIESVQRDRMTFLLVGLVGNTVVATTKSGAKYIGILSSTSAGSANGNAMNGAAAAVTPGIGILLSCAQKMESNGTLGPVKKTLLIPPEELEGFAARDVGLDVPVSTARPNQAGFRTDTEISKLGLDAFGEGRTLQRWADDSLDEPLERSMGSLALDDKKGASGGAWDQFAANEAKFGVKSNYDENMYTTKLDRSGRDFKERESKADQLAREIMTGATNNVHIAEERNLVPQGSSEPTEEDRYGAVVRGEGAYVPPAARRAAAAVANGSMPAAQATAAVAQATSPAARPTPPSIVTTAPPSSAAAAKDESKAQSAIQPSQDGALGDFKTFVTQERERLGKRKAAIAKDFEFADLKKWSDKFKLNFPIPEDFAQNRAASDGKSGDNATQKSASPVPHKAGHVHSSTETGGSPSLANGGSRQSDIAQGSRSLDTKSMLAKMTIPKIPPYNPERARARQAELQAQQSGQANKDGAGSGKSSFKLSAKASAFNPNASSFTPGAAFVPGAAAKSPALSAALAPAATAGPGVPVISPRAAAAGVATADGATPPTVPSAKPAVPINPFFGTRVIKKATAPLHVRDDFNPFKTGKVPDAATIPPRWGFTGKPYKQLFYAIPPDDASGNAAMSGMSTPSLASAKAGPSGSAPNFALPPGSVAQPGAPVMAMTSPHLPQPSPHLAHAQMPGHPQMHPQHLGPRGSQGNMPPGAGANGMGQPFYMPYPGYRFPGGQQPMQQMPGAPYGMPPQMMGQMPFSPQMSHAGPPAGMYSPQMGNVLPGGPMPNMMAARPGGGNHGGAHMQNKMPPNMYYQGQPMPGMPYAAPFVPGAGPPVVRPPPPQQQPPPMMPGGAGPPMPSTPSQPASGPPGTPAMTAGQTPSAQEMSPAPSVNAS